MEENNKTVLLEELFMSSPPAQLHQSLQTVFFEWLIENPDPPKELQKISQDFYWMLLFLKSCELFEEK